MTVLRTIRVLAWCGIAAMGALLLVSAALPYLSREAPVAETRRTIGKPFSLARPDGTPVSDTVLRGKPYLAFFGFTHCPDICPTTLFELTDLMQELGPEADGFNVAFITVDPERDSPELLTLYMEPFDRRIMALRGDAAQTAGVLQAFAAYAKRVPTGGESYTMDHTAGVYLMDRQGEFTGMLDMHEPRETRLQKLRNLIARPGA